MSAADLRTVKVGDNQVTYDPDMPMGVVKNLMVAGQESNIAAMMEAMRRLVVTWDYDGDPEEMESWDNLRRSQFLGITAAVMEDMAKLGEA